MDNAPSICDGSHLRVRISAATDVGLRRAHNEDSYGWWLPENAEQCRRRGMLLVIADGMGGARGGEVASRLAIDAMVRAYRESPGADLSDELRAALAAANATVHREGSVHPELSGMGTTCTAAAVREGEIVLAHVGDSRAYLARGGRIRQLTLDHSLVGQLVRDRHLTAEQARTDPRRNVVTRSVGIGSEVEIDVDRAAEKLEPGDTLVLCTDGLHGLVSDEELCAFASGRDLDRGCGQLIALARERGGHDNITVILARAEAGEGPGPIVASLTERTTRYQARRGRRGLIVTLLLALLALLLAIAWRLTTRRAAGV